ncbi:MAG TPA: hypothetical protein VFO62_01185, partial [Candidatus Binatia bacterium]|nr:hypothetical protein [Candidatus Binatia bacterium]
MSGFDRSLGACALRRGVVVALFALLAVVASGTHPERASAAGLCGDVDCSGSVSASDALALLQRAVGTISAVACPIQCSGGDVSGPLPAGLIVCGDVNCSGSVTASDALLTLKAAVGTAVPMQCGTECSGVSTTTSTTLPQSTDEESALAVIEAAGAVRALFENPIDAAAARSLRDS